MCIIFIYVYIFPGPCFVKFSGECQHPVHLHGRQGLHAAAAGQCGAPHQGTENVVRHHPCRCDHSEPLPVLFKGIKELRVGHEKMKLQVNVYIHILSYGCTCICIHTNIYISQQYMSCQSLTHWDDHKVGSSQAPNACIEGKPLRIKTKHPSGLSHSYGPFTKYKWL